MKRFLSLLLTLLLSLCLFCGCQSDTPDAGSDPDTDTAETGQQQSSQDTDPDTNQSDPITEPDWERIYDPILAQYRAAIENDFYQDLLRSDDEDLSVIGEQINPELLIASGYSDVYFVFCALQDIDANGTPELFIGGGTSTDTVTNYDVFTWDGTQIVPLFPDRQFGYRTTFRLLSDGTFAVTWSSSAAHSGSSFYRIAADGITAEEVESVCLKADPESSPDTLRYYHDAEGINEITEAEHNSILERYSAIPSMQLSWNTLSAS